MMQPMCHGMEMDLSPEWERVGLLAELLLGRNGNAEQAVARLERVDRTVSRLRKAGRWPLESLSEPGVAMDLLAAVYAPVAAPDVASLFESLQGRDRIAPTLALCHRLFAWTHRDHVAAVRLLATDGDLSKRGVVRVVGHGPMRELHPHPDWQERLTGVPSDARTLPGAVEVETCADPDALVLSPGARRMLDEFILWVRHAGVVRDWGGDTQHGPVALFSGPSGTGKTFAARVIAGRLGWSLHRVDLGRLVSKYIGETEKNLNALFDAARGQRVVLQFDEVDALMGRRGEVRDARDRYANMEVSHLLSRIECHDGPCILTTNLRRNIDSAFLRRFHFVVAFERPDAAQRRALWERCLPGKAPRAASLDLDLVAEAASLTGGEIRNAAHHAAVLAAAQGVPIGLEHVAAGVWRVLQKGEERVDRTQLRALAPWLPEESGGGS